MDKKIQRFKLVCIGDSECGKSQLIQTYTKDTFSIDYEPTVIDSESAFFSIGEKVIELEIWDTCGEHDLDSDKRMLCYPETDFFIFCFSLVDPQSFSNILKFWVKEIEKFKKQYKVKIPCVLVGLKVDIRENSKIEKELRNNNLIPITTKEGQKLAKRIGASYYYEVSSKTKRNVKDLFIKIGNLLSVQKSKTEEKENKIYQKALKDVMKKKKKPLFNFANSGSGGNLGSALMDLGIPDDL